MIFLNLTFILSVVFTINSFAEDSIPKKLFTIEKNYNPENIMIIETQIDNNCKFLNQNNKYLDYYWMMNKTKRKEIHPMIRSQIEEKVKFHGIDNEKNLIKLKLNDFRELKHDLEDILINISATLENGICDVKSILKLGPSSKYRKIDIKRIYCEVSTNLFGIPDGCKFIELSGADADTGEDLKVRFSSK